jgi:hypothetical protein
MDVAQPLAARWVRLGAAAGLVACLAYPLAVFAPLPLGVVATLVALFGPALAVASLGLYQAIRLHAPSVAAGAAAVLNVMGGGLFTAMLLVQIAVGVAIGPAAEPGLQAVWLGLDVAWDAYISLGTLLFALAMLRHPRFGPLFAYSGLVIGGLLFAFNLLTFPTPPANAGLIDLGPAVGLWYLAVTVQLWRSFGWADRLAPRQGRGGAGAKPE